MAGGRAGRYGTGGVWHKNMSLDFMVNGKIVPIKCWVFNIEKIGKDRFVARKDGGVGGWKVAFFFWSGIDCCELQRVAGNTFRFREITFYCARRWL